MRDALGLLGLLLAATPLAGCSPGTPPKTPTTGILQPLGTPDGDRTVTMANTRLNSYAALVTDATAGGTQLAVDPTQLTAMGLSPGDLLLVIQMQGATIDTAAAAPTHGTVTGLGDAGHFELIGVAGVTLATGTVRVDGLCGGLKNSYSATGKTQIVRVPQYGNLVVSSSGQVVPAPWDGAVGGVLAIRANRVEVQGGGSIDASRAGFRGGSALAAGATKSMATDATPFASASADDGSGKGEGVAGRLTTLGRGAAGNGGGGGNAYGAGGGGGANAGDPVLWTGVGVMALVNGNDATAWMQDPAYAAALSNSTGGGRGGYTLAQNDQLATTAAPGDPTWGGNARRERGGRGGSPLAPSAPARLFLGGGGGAGDRISTTPVMGGEGGGGAGGGLVYILANSVDGTGSIKATGGDGSSTTGPATGGAGGGGGGGTIVLNTLSLRGSLTLSTDGGGGGSQNRVGVGQFFNDALGPGAGGGGGFIALPGGVPAGYVQSAKGGAAGQTFADVVTEFPSNGATAGRAGTTGASLNPAAMQTPICAPLDLRLSITNALSTATLDSEISYLITVYNDGPFPVVNAPITGSLSPALDFVDWSCSADAAGGDPAQVGCTTTLGVRDVNTRVSLTPGARASLVVRAIVPEDATGNLVYTANVAAPSTVSDTDPTNNTGTVTTAVGAQADLALTATVAPSPTKSGQPVTFILSVTNNGPNSATDVAVSFDIPGNASLTPGTQPAGDGWTCTVQQAGPQITCRRPDLPRGAGPDVLLTLTPQFQATYVVGSARVTAATLDRNASNNSATAVATLEYDPAHYRETGFAGGGIGCGVVSSSGGNARGALGLPGALMALAGIAWQTARIARRRRRTTG